MNKTLYSILKEISELSTTQAKVEALQISKYTQAFRIICAYAYDPNLKWLLPEGDPPFRPCDFVDVEGRFLSELRKLYLFVEGGNPNLTKLRREALYIQMLESIDANDAKLLLSIKDKKLPFKGLNKKIIQQAFPEINFEKGE
jgi:hypothetical protein